MQGGAWDLHRHDYGNRRPLHYVRTLRQPIIGSSQASDDQGKTQQGNLIRNQKKPSKQTLSLPQVFSSQPAQQRNPPPARPRGFQLNLDIPLLELGPNQMPHTVTKVSHESPAAEVNLLSRPQSSSPSVPEKSRPDPHGWTRDHVPKLQLGLSSSTTARTPSLSMSDYVRLAHLIKENRNVQSRYIEPAQQLLDLMQAESRPPLNYADAVRKQVSQMGSRWPILSSDAGKGQNQEVESEIPAAKEIEGWLPAQHGSPALSPAGQSWAYQKPNVGKSPPHPTRKHPEQVDLYPNAHTGIAQDRDRDPTILSKPNLNPSSVLQHDITHQFYQLPGDRQYGNNYDPGNIEIQGSVKLGDPAFGKGLMTAKAGHEPSPPRLQLSLSLPIQAKTQNVDVQGNDNQNVKTVKQITQTGSNWPSSSPEFTKSAPQTEMKHPHLSFNAGHQSYQQQPHDYIQIKPAVKPPFSTQYSNQWMPRPNQDETPTGQSPAVHKPAITRPSAVSYSPTNSRHDSYSDYQGSRNHLDKAVGLTPSLPHKAPSSYHTSGVFSEQSHGIQHASAPESDHYGSFKPSTERSRTAERMHHGSMYDHTTLMPPNWYAAAATSAYETRPHHQQKHVFSEESSQHRHRFPSGHETQKTFPKLEAGHHVRDGQDKSAKIFINFDRGVVAIDGQSDTKTNGYHGKWEGETEGPQSQTTNPSTINLQALMTLDKGALTDLLKSHHQSRRPSYVQSGCIGQAGDCSQQARYFPKQDSYTPYAEATSVTVPSNAQQHFFESRSYHI